MLPTVNQLLRLWVYTIFTLLWAKYEPTASPEETVLICKRSNSAYLATS